MMVACGQCGTESTPAAKFCAECGARLHQPSSAEPECAQAEQQMAEAEVTLPAPDASKRPPRPSAPPPLKHGAKSRTVVLVQFTAVQPCGLHRPIPRRAAPPPPAPQVLPPPRSHSPPPLPLGPIPAYARDLNPQQQQAVLAPTNEPLLVLAATCADTCVPEPRYCAYGLRVPASCVLHVPEARGSLPPRRQAKHGTHAYQPRAQCTHRAPWRHRRLRAQARRA
jgi:hypothetical protein